MADKTASIKVDLKGDEAKAGIRSLGTETKKTAGEMGSSLKGALSEGMKGGVDAVKSALSTIKSTVLSIGGIAGGLGLAEMARGAVAAQGEVRRLAFRIGEASGGAAKLGADMHAMAVSTGQPVEELIQQFDSLQTKIGDTEFAKSALGDIAKAATTTGFAMAPLVDIVDATNATFGVTAQEVPDVLAQMIGLASKSGLSIEEFAAKFELVGVSAKGAGLAGKDGLAKTAALMAMADSSAGGLKKGLPAVTSLLDTLGNKAARMPLLLQMGINPNMKGDATDVIGEILKKTGGKKEEIEKHFGGAQAKLLVDMGASYAQAFDETKGKVKEKSAAGLAAYQAALLAAGKSTLSAADVNKQFADEMNSGERKVAVALERLKSAFAKPEVTAAIEKLMGALPALADVITKVIGFASDNPVAAGAAALGGTFAKGAIESMIVGAFKSGAAAAAPGLSGALAGGAGPFATALGPLMGPIGLALGASIGIMLLASMHQAKLDQQKRDAEAADAQRMLKQGAGPMGGAYQAAGALEAATGIEFDPNTAISDDTAGRATSGLDAHDKVMQERLLAKAKGGADMLKFGNKLAANHPEWFMTETNAQGVSPSAAAPPLMSGTVSTSGTTTKAPDPQAQASATASAIASKTINVFVKNAKDIGGSGGAGGGPTGGGFVIPGYVVRQ